MLFMQTNTISVQESTRKCLKNVQFNVHVTMQVVKNLHMTKDPYNNAPADF